MFRVPNPLTDIDLTLFEQNASIIQSLKSKYKPDIKYHIETIWDEYGRNLRMAKKYSDEKEKIENDKNKYIAKKESLKHEIEELQDGKQKPYHIQIVSTEDIHHQNQIETSLISNKKMIK